MCVLHLPFYTPVYVHDGTCRVALDFSGGPTLTFNGAPGNVRDSLVGRYYVCVALYWKTQCMYDQNCVNRKQ